MKLFLLLIFVCNALLSAKDFKGAEYRTIEAYKYGRFEVNYKTANREGVLASFFTYFDGTPTDPWAASKWNEIDLEILGRYENDIQFNTITPQQQNHVRHQFVNFNPHLDYHTYAFEWTPDYVAWFVDGIEVYRQTGAHIQTLNKAQKIMMNIWNPTYPTWVGGWNPEILPAFAFYDWVSCYSYTPGSGNYGSGNNFTHLWTDNFDSWDQTRWQKATHTWNGNNCDFVHENVVFKDGKMILCLTDNTNLGYTDKKAPLLLSATGSGNKVTGYFSEELDEQSAELKSNYIIAGVTIDEVVLQPNQKNVELTVTGMDNSLNYNLIANNIKDRSATQNTSTLKATLIHQRDSTSFPYKINVGGMAISGYLADQQWSSAVEYGYLDGQPSVYSNQINGTDEDIIYNSDHYGLVTYKVRVPNGNYKVKLMFAENYFTQSGARVFDVYIENKTPLNNIDIVQAVGQKTAYDIIINDVSVADEILDIHFCAEVDNPLLSGLIIEQSSTGLLDNETDQPNKFSLKQNYPNPFNPATKVSFVISHKSFVTLKIFDVLGNEIATLINEEKAPGEYEVEFSAEGFSGSGNLASGIYFYKMYASGFTATKKMVLLN
jgi:beta-glucanase (GH16 family)